MNNIKPIKSAIRGKSKKRIPFLKVVETKKQVIDIFEGSDKARDKMMNDLMNKYAIGVCKYYNIGYGLMSEKEQDNFIECLAWIGDLFNEMKYDKEYFLELLDTPISQMEQRQKFNRIFLAFLYRPEDLLTISLLKDSLIELKKMQPRNKIFKTFEKYFDLILDATISQLENGEIDIKLDYLREKLIAVDDDYEEHDYLLI